MAKLGRAVLDVAPLVVLAGAGVSLLGSLAPKEARARWHERGRGRRARSPQEIPAKGWKDILLRTKTEFQEDQIPMIAAGVTFYTLLSFFPALGAFVALYGLFADVAQAQRHLQILAFMLPPDALKLIGEQMVRLAAGNDGGLSLAFAANLLLSIWSANGAMKAMMTGLNIAYDESEKRNFVRKTATSLAFTLGFLAFVLAACAVLAIGPALETFAGREAAFTFKLIAWPSLLFGMGVALATLYRYGPSRDRAQWRWISWGSVVAIVAWVVACAGFSIYVGSFANYDKTYGPLGAVIAFMVWSWISTVVILFGAELNAEIEHQTAVDTTAGAPQPLGFRGAKMADTIGAAQDKARKPSGRPPKVQRAA